MNLSDPDLKVAIVHYWLVSMGGGEKVVQAILELFPQADVFTLVYDESIARKVVGNRKITASYLQRLPFSRKRYRAMLPLMPSALEQLDLDGYDLIISSESGPAKGILPPLDALHVCYCHSPMRYIWDNFQDYRKSAGRLTRIMMDLFINRLRTWDYVTSARVDAFAANSRHVRKRIRRYYRRNASVVHPPVDVDLFVPGQTAGDFYLITGRHVAYKKVDVAIAACQALGRRLVVTGEGPETERLKRMAGPLVTFAGQCGLNELRRLYAECHAFLMPGEEDFGIAPVEAMASGRPVIALARGGALDTVEDGVSGILYDRPGPDGLADAIRRFEAEQASFSPAAISDYAQRFSKEAFKQNFLRFVAQSAAQGADEAREAGQAEPNRRSTGILG